jgi:hypothetical protein
MKKFTVKQGGKRPQIDYYSLYLNAFMRTILNAKDECYAVKKKLHAVFYGVKSFGLINTDEIADVGGTFNLMESVKLLIGFLTPNELMQIFPVEKTYDGKRWQTKDYYYTMKVLTQHGLDTPIGEAVDNILWDYMNMDLRMFQVNLLSVVGKFYRAKTGREMFVDAFEEISGERLTTYTMIKNSATGREIMRNNVTGEMMRVRKPLPRYVKLHKGGI